MSGGRLLIHSAKQVVQVVNKHQRYLQGKSMKSLAILEQTEKGEGHSIVCDHHGNIAAIGSDSEISGYYDPSTFDNVIDATGKCVIPGLVDGHTHAVWVGDRVHEFAMKLAGASYMEVHAAGGGINFTVDHVHKATHSQLYKAFKKITERMVHAGTTLAEVKSGYGLDLENEMKMLKVIEEGKNDPNVHIDISSTYCGGHATPKDKTADEAVKDIIEIQIPALREAMEKGEIHVDNIDVFCEKNVFDVRQTEQILKAGKEMGLKINFHGEELSCLNSAEMGAKLKARAISHLEKVSDEGIKGMSEAKTCAVILPTTAYQLRLEAPPVRKMLEEDVIVALGSDFNPNAHCLSMPIVMNLACVTMKMTMEEALAASTINAAYSMGKEKTHGSLEIGKKADILVLEEPRWEHLIYQMGGHADVIKFVIKDGHVVVE